MSNELASNIFGKTIHDLTEQDIKKYFETERRETNIMEFKSYVDKNEPGTTKESRDKKKLRDVIKTICAFLNSDGGILIWGAPLGQKKVGSNEVVYFGPITKVNYKIEPDQIINKIASEISPTPLRINFQPIDLGAGDFQYVFEVRKSEFAPHQQNGTYYMRMDGSTRPAPHHFVEALMKKINFPRVEVFLTFGEAVEFLGDYVSVPVQLSIHNLSKYIPEKNIQYRIICDTGDILSVNLSKMPELKRGSDILGEKVDILHNRVAHFQFYALVTNRFFGGKKKNFTILVSLNGELSPVIFSKYDIQLSMVDPASNVQFTLLEKTENIYLSDSGLRGISENEVVEKSNNSYFEKFERDFSNKPLYKALGR